MSQPSKILATLVLGAVSGLGFYSVSSPVTRLSTFATQYFFPSFAESGGSSVHKTDRGVALRTAGLDFRSSHQEAASRPTRGRCKCKLPAQTKAVGTRLRVTASKPKLPLARLKPPGRPH